MDISTVLVLIWCSTRTKGGLQRKKLLLLVFWALPKLEGGGSPVPWMSQFCYALFGQLWNEWQKVRSFATNSQNWPKPANKYINL